MLKYHILYYLRVKNWYDFLICEELVPNFHKYQILTRLTNRYQNLTSVKNWYQIKMVSKLIHVKNWYLQGLVFYQCDEYACMLYEA